MAIFSSLVYAAHQSLRNSATPIGVGHLNELFAAALGYKSLAAFQASDFENLTFADGIHLLVDSELLSERIKSLGLLYPVDSVLRALTPPLTEALSADRVHLNEFSLLDAFQQIIEADAMDSDEVSSQMAMTNAYLDSVDLPLEVRLGDITSDEALEVTITGSISLKQDEDKAYYGNKVEVSVDLSLRKVGASAFEIPEILEVRAGLVDPYAETADDPDSMLSANHLAEILGIEREEAFELDYTLTQLTTNDGIDYAYLLEVSRHNPEEVLDNIRLTHPDLSVRLSINTFDSPDSDDGFFDRDHDEGFESSPAS